ncbi:hypothetical protein VP01_873g9 [Puccinia sorghi]|uniref:Uncharacterized protein n=1 Tax=Puccinia sorghi TaxID=27349 RepID=A0A0L6U8Q1_9BASI|nr:hypothetical protein VP01_873g9 [Puccinia sorghi]
MSSTESKMNALLDREQENQCLAFLIEELWKTKLEPTLFHIENKGLLAKLKNFGSNSKSKHIDIKFKSLREKFKNNEITVKLISSDEILANSLTKAAPISSIHKFQNTFPQSHQEPSRSMAQLEDLNINLYNMIQNFV